MTLNWNLQGVGRFKLNNLSWGKYRYFLEQHNVLIIFSYLKVRVLGCLWCFASATYLQYYPQSPFQVTIFTIGVDTGF